VSSKKFMGHDQVTEALPFYKNFFRLTKSALGHYLVFANLDKHPDSREERA
jgi:hypothetical protein